MIFSLDKIFELCKYVCLVYSMNEHIACYFLCTPIYIKISEMGLEQIMIKSILIFNWPHVSTHLLVFCDYGRGLFQKTLKLAELRSKFGTMSRRRGSTQRSVDQYYILAVSNICELP